MEFCLIPDSERTSTPRPKARNATIPTSFFEYLLRYGALAPSALAETPTFTFTVTSFQTGESLMALVPPSRHLDSLAEEALDALDSRRDESIRAWARRLASDVFQEED
jgi:hypothetical protein